MDLFSILFFVFGVPLTLVTAVYAHSTLLYARGDLAQQKGRLDQAERLFKKAATGRNPLGRAIAFTALGRVYLKMNEPARAMEALREAMRRAKTPAVVMATHQLYIEAAQHPAFAGDRGEVLREAEKLMTATGMARPLKAVVFMSIAGAWYRQQNLAEAARLTAVTLEHDALQPAGLFLAGWVDLAQGKRESAKARFTALTNVSAKDQKPLGPYGLGALAFFGGDLGDAESFFQKAVESGGRLLEPFALARLSMTRALLGKDAYDPLKRAHEVVKDLAARGALKPDSGAHWLLAMARAYADGNPQAAVLAAEAAPVEDRAEAAHLARILETGKRSAGWSPS
jgi:tetratricopeptide (TPR) repeat protein